MRLMEDGSKRTTMTKLDKKTAVGKIIFLYIDNLSLLQHTLIHRGLAIQYQKHTQADLKEPY